MKKIFIVVTVMLMVFGFMPKDFYASKLKKKSAKVYGVTTQLKPFSFREGTRGVDIKNSRIYKVFDADSKKKIGYLYVGEAPSRMNKFDYALYLDTQMKIKKVEVLMYRENYGGQIGNKLWLKQFIGKVNGEQMKFESDIDGISGATISSKSITYNISKISKVLKQIQNNGKL